MYVPRAAAGRPPAAGQADELTPTATVRALLLNLLLVAGIGAIGLVLALAILKDADVALLLAASIPIGQAALTWTLFLLSWLGVRLNAGTVLVVGLLLVVVPGTVTRVWQGAEKGASEGRSSHTPGAPPIAFGWVVRGVITGFGLVVSVMRSYSTWDDMSAYAVQGYAIAHEGSVAATQKWGPVAASYPLNVSLAISLFHFLDGDILPGSKFLFPFFLGAILLSGYRVWREVGHSDARAAALALALGTTPLVLDHSTTGYTNLPFATYLALGCVLAPEGFVHREWRKQLIGGICLAAAIWTRPEGLLVVWGVIAVLLIIAVRVARGSVRTAAIPIPPAVLSLSWLACGAGVGAGGQMPGTPKAVTDAVAVGDLHVDAPYWTLRYLGRSLVDPSIWGLLLPLALLLLVAAGRPRWPPRHSVSLGLLAASATVGAAVFVFYYLVSFSGDLRFWLGTGVERMFLPAGVLAWLAPGGLGVRSDKVL